MEAEKRRAVPLSICLEVALRQLVEAWRAMGRIAADESPKLELDHLPALVLRNVDPATGQHIPHQHDPLGLAYKTVAEHKVKTHGNGATNRGSDRGEAARLRRLVEKRERREAEAAARFSELNGDEPIDELPKYAKIKKPAPKSRIRSAKRWPPRKVRPPYRRKGV